MAKKLLAFLLVFVVLVSSMSTAIISVAAATDVKQTLNISVVTTDTTNNLLTTLKANYDGIKHYTTLDDALADVGTNGTKGIMVLADNYPNSTTAITDTQAAKINGLGVRLYVEYPANNDTLGIAGFDGTGKMGYDRAIVMDAEKMGMDKYSLLYVHGAQYVKKTDISNSWLVNATVVGYDKVEFYDEETGALTDCTPYSMIEESGNVLIASTKLSQFINARYAPYARWQSLWHSVLSWVSGETVTSFDWTPSVTSNYDNGEVLASDAYSEAVRLNTEWFLNSTIMPNSDGTEGIYECFKSGSNFNVYGDQYRGTNFRSDCNAESLGAIALAGALLDNDQYKTVASNVMNWFLNESELANGERADITKAQYGLLSWHSGAMNQYYGDDNAKAILGLILGAAALETKEYDERILEAILANFRTTGKNGFRGAVLNAADLEANGWEYYYNSSTTDYRSHFESLLWACYLWAYDKTGYEPLLERSKTAISMMMTAYDNAMAGDDDNSDEWYWTNGLQQERAKMILPLAWLARLEPTDEHIGWLEKMIGDMMYYQDETTGAIREVKGENGVGVPVYTQFEKNSDYGKHESPVIQNNGEPCTDSLYTSSFAMMALNEAYAAMAANGNTELAEKYQGYAKSVSDYHVRIQQVSSRSPQYNGVWFRGFDYKKWETYGSDGDSGWGIWCAETGWCQSWISATLSLQEMNTNIWDYTKTTTVDDYFVDTAVLMLNYEPGEPTVTVEYSDDTSSKRGDANVLLNGLYGTTTYSDGQWIGAEGPDMTVVIDYQQSKTFDSISLDFLNNMTMGISIPKEVTFYYSTNGVEYTKIGTCVGVTDVQAAYDNRTDATSELMKIVLDESITARYVKAEVTNPGNFTNTSNIDCKTWMFMDEFETSLTVTMAGLEILIEKASMINTYSYQPATAIALENAYKAALEFYNSGSTDNEQLHTVYNNLNDAINGLQTNVYSYSTNSSFNSVTSGKLTDGIYNAEAARGEVIASGANTDNPVEQTVELIFDMGQSTSIMYVGYAALSRPGSGIYMQNAEYFVSDSLDGTWTSVATIKGTPDADGVYTTDEYQSIYADASGDNGRYVKVVFSRCADYEVYSTWPTQVNQSQWLFLTEVMINRYHHINVTAENAVVEITDSAGGDASVIGVKDGESSVTVKITPEENCLYNSVTLNGEEVALTADNTFVIENITADQEVIVKYGGISEEDLPVINVKELFVKTSDAASFNPLIDVTAYDKDGKDVTSKVTYTGSVGTTAGTYTITYEVEDDNGYVNRATAEVHVVSSLNTKHVIAVTPFAGKGSYSSTEVAAQRVADGVYASTSENHSSSRLASWQNIDCIEIVIALGSDTAITDLGYSLLSCPQYGYLAPDVELYIADSLGAGTATQWQHMGTIEAEVHPIALNQVDYIKNTISLAEGTTAKYVKAVIRSDTDQDVLSNYSATPGGGVPEWTFVDEIIVTDDALKFDGASMTIKDTLAINYKVNSTVADKYTNLYAKFISDGKEYIVDKYTVDGEHLVFTFDSIAAQRMSDTILAAVYGTGTDSKLYVSGWSVYSIKQYCHNVLDEYNTTDYTGDKYDKMRTLLVDMLNYGACSQEYTGHNTDNLANADLTDVQKAWATATTPSVESIRAPEYEKIDNPTVSWSSGGLYIRDSVMIRLAIKADSLVDLSIKVKCGDDEWTVSAKDNIDCFKWRTDGEICDIYFNGFYATQMREPIYFTVYIGDEAVSNTLRYSVESYVAVMQNNESVGDLVIAMMKYGDAAAAYAKAQ